MDYAKEIYKLIAGNLPLTGLELGSVMPAVSINIDDNKVLFELSNDDYAFIQGQITENSNYSYTASNFRIKNRITEIILHPSDSYNKFGFLVKFDNLFIPKTSTQITLKGFADTNYNTTYKIIEKIDDFNVILAPLNDLAITIPAGDLGFYSTMYSNGLNGLKIIEDEGSNVVSFTMEEHETSFIENLTDLDLDTMPNLWFYQDSILQLNAQTFIKNLTDSDNKDYLIIDTSSFVGSPIRSQHNKTDAPNFSFGSNAYFYRNYTLNVLYMLQRSIDDSDNLTGTGADIVNKQVEMFDALTSILRRPIPSDNTKVISSITITEDAVDDAIIEGSVIINYQCSFTINYLPDSLLDLQESGIYDINQINYNSNQIIV
jgi:hypothetical protein